MSDPIKDMRRQHCSDIHMVSLQGCAMRGTNLPAGNIKIPRLDNCDYNNVTSLHLDIDGGGNISLLVYFCVEISRKNDQPSD